jgi:hypothetical protein
VLATGCLGWGDIDPSGLSERMVVGAYRLKQWEDGTSYYLVSPADTGDLIPGPPLARLGWDRTHAVVLRRPEGAGPGAWTVYDLSTGRALGPLTAADVAADPAVAKIPTLRADSARARLAR